MMSAAFIAYLAPFTSDYRAVMLDKWIKRLKEEKVPTSSDFTIQRILSEEVQIREWRLRKI